MAIPARLYTIQFQDLAPPPPRVANTWDRGVDGQLGREYRGSFGTETLGQVPAVVEISF